MNKTSEYRFTIIVPVYNEEDNMQRLEDELSFFAAQAPVSTCVLFVNDGSADNSLAGIERICDNHKDFYYISFARNCGLSAAIKAGIDLCESEYVGYIDADLQTSPMDFNRLLAYVQDYALVTGIRTGRKDSVWKKCQSKIANSFRRMMTGDTAQDTGCPLKVMHTNAARKMPFFKGMHRFIPALMLLQGEEMKQISVSHFPRQAGVSKFSMRNRFFGPLADCFAYRWMKTRYINYNIAESNV